MDADVETRRGEVSSRKERGAFFTPPAIADYLASWAIGGNPEARVLDPTCGEAVFLLSAGRKLRRLGRSQDDLRNLLFGVDLDQGSLDEASGLLAAEDLDARLLERDFFDIPTPGEPGCPIPQMDAVVGNPPFIRYQLHRGEARRRSASAALRQGVRLTGLASSWAALAVHASAFLKPEGRLAMVFPAELLTVNYAEPVRRWLRRRFAAVHLVMFERLQFDDALEKVVLVIAQGSGGCDAFALWHLEDATDLAQLHGFDSLPVTPADEGKWTDLLLPNAQRQLFKRITRDHFVSLRNYGSPELGTVTGANGFFTMSEATRQRHELPVTLLTPISPPGTRHLQGTSFSTKDWERLRDAGERVWLLNPDVGSRSTALRRYVAEGERLKIHEAYKCSIRDPWWKPPVVPCPDFFFTYMSHRFPRIIANTARTSYVNSMHGIRLHPPVDKSLRASLPLLALNSVTILGAELFGRSYGGGILKMEPREAGTLPMPGLSLMDKAWGVLRPFKAALERQLRQGRWTSVLAKVDDVLLRESMGASGDEVAQLHEAARRLREQRLGSGGGTNSKRAGDRGGSGAPR